MRPGFLNQPSIVMDTTGVSTTTIQLNINYINIKTTTVIQRMYPLAVNILEIAHVQMVYPCLPINIEWKWMGKHWAPTDLTFTRQLETGSACVAGCGSFGCGPQHSAGHVRLRTREVTWIGAAAGGFHKATPKWVNEWFIIENPIKILLKCMISGDTRMDWKPPYGPHPTLGSRHPG